AGRVPAHRGSASPAVRRAAGLLLVVAAALPQSAATAQQTSPYVAAERAESLRLAGRPWHAAETLLAAAAREPRLNATLVVEGAKAELHARRYDRARSLLVGQPWLEDYGDGDALAVLAEAEARLGLGMEAAGHYAAARARARGARAALLAVREGLAWEAAGARGSAAAARAAGGRLGPGGRRVVRSDGARARTGRCRGGRRRGAGRSPAPHTARARGPGSCHEGPRGRGRRTARGRACPPAGRLERRDAGARRGAARRGRSIP